MAEKEFESGDPFEMVHMVLDVPADEKFYTEMAQTFVEEYMRMGWSNEEIFDLFQDKFYQAVHDVLQKMGEPFVRNLINEVRHG